MSARALDRIPALAFALLASIGTLSARAEAHRIGLSQGEYALSGAHVTSRLTFAASELISVIPSLDGDGDGRLSEAELSQRTEALRAEFVDRTIVSANGETCSGVLESAAGKADDGVVLVARHECRTARGNAAVELGFLSDLESGHRHVARIAGGSGSVEVVAYAGNARLNLGTLANERVTRPAVEYVRLGIEHILGGADHLLFLLGVVLLPASFRSLVLAVTAFTVSHSLTLVLATLGIVRPSAAWVEPAIALSVAYVGLENWFLRDASRRWRLTFAFGLVHGLGFAGALRDVGIPTERLPVALAGFNLGVEAGQLLVVAILWTAVDRFRQRAWFRPWVLRLASAGLILAGSVWCVERTGVFRRRAVAAVSPAVGASARAPSTRASQSVEPPSTVVPPIVDRVCRAFSELPRIRRAECSGAKPGISMTAQCARTLATSVTSGAVSLVEAEVDRCLSEWNQRYDGCGFAEQRSLPPLAACEHVFRGNLGVDATCRSSLECGTGFHCDGVGPMDAGKCRPLRDDGASCGFSIDPLVAYVQSAAGPELRECTGVCVNNRCRKPVAGSQNSTFTPT